MGRIKTTSIVSIGFIVSIVFNVILLSLMIIVLFIFNPSENPDFFEVQSKVVNLEGAKYDNDKRMLEMESSLKKLHLSVGKLDSHDSTKACECHCPLQESQPCPVCGSCAECPQCPQNECPKVSCATGQQLQTASLKEIGDKFGTDKVFSRGFGHHYETFYEKWLGPYRSKGSFGMIEVGFASGNSAVMWEEWLPNADLRELEIGCIEGAFVDGKNAFIRDSPYYEKWLPTGKLYCHDVKDWEKTQAVIDSMEGLDVVIDDGSHNPREMAWSFLYFFPRIEPGGLFIMEDLQPEDGCEFTEVIIKPLLEDLLNPNLEPAKRRFPQYADCLRSIACEFEICVLERNQKPCEMRPLPDVEQWPLPFEVSNDPTERVCEL